MAADKGAGQVEVMASRLQTLEVEYVKPEDLAPNSYNPNRQSPHEFELLCQSMKQDGFTQPIIAHGASKQIIDGEHRWRAAKELEYDKVPVVFVDMSPEQMRVSTLRHNRARGTEDVELSADVLKDLQELGALGWAQDALLLDDKEIDVLVNDVTAAEGLAGVEFSEAWEPAGQKANTEDETTHATPAAEKAIKESEQRVREAKSPEEKVAAQEAQRAANLYRLVVVYRGDEAERVKEALGDQPAVRVVELCRAATAQEG